MRQALSYLLVLFALSWPVSAFGEARVIEMDFRIVLAQLAQKVGANGQIAILQAQGSDPAPAIVIQGGPIALDDIAAKAGGAIEQSGQGRYRLTRPLLVWNDSRLDITGGAELEIDAESGAFLAVFGALKIAGGAIRAHGERPDSADRFHPFVLIAGQGYLEAEQARFEQLGFGTIPAFSGVALINRGIFPPLADSKVIDSTFIGNGTLSLLSVEDAQIDGNRFEDHRGNGITIRASKTIRLRGNRIARVQGHGLRISEGSESILVEDNDILDAARTGVLVDRRSVGVALLANTVRRAGSSGLQIDEAFCVQFARNDVSDGLGAGITIRRSAFWALIENSVARHRGAGIAVSAQPKSHPSQVYRNRLAHNRVGLRGTTTGEMELLGNDFTEQFPRFLDGDLARNTLRLVRNLKGEDPMTIDGAHDTRAVILPDCTLPGDA